LSAFGTAGESAINNWQLILPATSTVAASSFWAYWESGAGTDRTLDLGKPILNADPTMLHFVKNSSALTLSLYVNGRLFSQGTYTNEPTSGTSGVGINAVQFGGSQGQIGHWAFFDGVLSDDSIFAQADAAGLAHTARPAITESVQSVNGKTGPVVVHSDDISDSGRTHKFTTDTDAAKMANISVTQPVDLDAVESTANSALQNIVADTTPQFGGEVDAQRNNLLNLRRLDIVGQSGGYSSAPGAFLSYSGNHSYSYLVGPFFPFLGTEIPAAVYFSGVHTIDSSGYVFGMGSLFWASAKLTNNAAVAANFGPYFTLNANMTFEANNQTVSLAAGADALLFPIFQCAGSGTLAVTAYSQTLLQMTIGAGVTVTTRIGSQYNDATNSGTFTSQAAVAVAALGAAANNTCFLTGTTTVPTGANYNTYQANTYVNRWGGGHRFVTRESASTTVTVTTADDTVRMSSTSTVACGLPDATTCTGLRLTLIKTGASGTINVSSVSNQVSSNNSTNRTSTPWTMTTRGHVLQIQSNGTGWDVLINGVVP
jgi:hypothetical protein